MLRAHFDITAHDSPQILPMLLVRRQLLKVDNNAKGREGEKGSKPNSSPPLSNCPLPVRRGDRIYKLGFLQQGCTKDLT